MKAVLRFDLSKQYDREEHRWALLGMRLRNTVGRILEDLRRLAKDGDEKADEYRRKIFETLLDEGIDLDDNG